MLAAVDRSYSSVNRFVGKREPLNVMNELRALEASITHSLLRLASDKERYSLTGHILNTSRYVCSGLRLSLQQNG